MISKNKKFVILLISGFLLLGYFFVKTISFRNLRGEGDEIVGNKEESKELIKDGKPPEGFPKDFPVYPNSHIVSGWQEVQDENRGYSIIIETGDSINDVYNYYKTELTKRGWALGSDIKTADTGTVSFEKEGSRGFVGMSKKVDKVEVLATIGIIE